MNKELYNQLLGAAAVMAEAQKCDNAMQNNRSLIASLEGNIRMKEDKIKNSKRSYKAMTVWGVILMIMGFCNAGLFLFAVLYVGLGSVGAGKVASIGEFLSDSEIAPFKVFIFIFVVMGILGLFMRNSARIKRKKYMKKVKKECEEDIENIQKNIKEKKEYIEQIRNGLRKFAAENEYLLEFLPNNYRNPHAIYFMLQAVENLRADSLKEAINLYEYELHLLEQERILNNNALMQQRYNESMQQMMQVIDANQQQINSNLRFVQTLQLLNLFDDE